MNLRSRLKKEKSKQSRGKWKSGRSDHIPSPDDDSPSESEYEEEKIPLVENNSSNFCLLFFLLVVLILFVAFSSCVYICCEDYTRHPDCSKLNPLCVEYHFQPHKILDHGFRRLCTVVQNRFESFFARFNK